MRWGQSKRRENKNNIHASLHRACPLEIFITKLKGKFRFLYKTILFTFIIRIKVRQPAHIL